MKLTRSERLWLARRRAGLTQAEMACRFGISEDKYRAMEHGRTPAPSMKLWPEYPLTSGEVCALCRRRWRWTLDTVARLMGKSRVTVIQMEHDRWPNGALVQFWQMQEWSAAAEQEPKTQLPLGEWAKDLNRRPV